MQWTKASCSISCNNAIALAVRNCSSKSIGEHYAKWEQLQLDRSLSVSSKNRLLGMGRFFLSYFGTANEVATINRRKTNEIGKISMPT